MLIDSCITQLKAQGPSRTCDESKEEESVISQEQEASMGSSGNASGPQLGSVRAQIELVRALIELSKSEERYGRAHILAA